MTQINNAKLEWNDAGTPVSEQFDDVYFSNVNGLAESRYVFIEQNGLPQRLLSHAHPQFVVAETGFGTGLNFLALCQVYTQFCQQHPDSDIPRLHFISFEKFPVTQEDLVKAHQSWPELEHFATQLQQQYPEATAGCHRLSFLDGAISLDLWFGDIKDCMPQLPTPKTSVVDAWFLDGFAPSKNPEMWTQELFQGMVNLGRSHCSVATFTAAGFVRRGLIEAGFEMRKAKGFGTKRDMLVGTLPTHNSFSNLDHDLPRNSLPNEHSDVAIIGGGIASVTLAEALLKRGKTVTLYCKDSQLAQGASKNDQGAIYPLLSSSSVAIHNTFTSAYQHALRYYAHKAQHVSFDHNWCGVVQLMWDEKQTKKLTAIGDLALPHGISRSLDSEETNSVTGLEINVDSLHYKKGGWLAPQQLVQQLGLKLAEYPHFSLKLDTEIVQLSHSDLWELTDQNQIVYSHQSVVVANGHLFDQLTPTASMPLGKVKGQVSAIQSSETLSKLNTVLCYEGYLTPKSELDNRHRIGASYDRGHLDEEFDAVAQQDNRNKLTKCLPDCSWTSQVNVDDHVAKQGIRCVSRDHLPFVGEVLNFERLKTLPSDGSIEPATQPGLYALVALGSRGLTTAPLLAEILASQMCGEPIPLGVDLLNALEPNRMWIRKRRKGKALI